MVKPTATLLGDIPVGGWLDRWVPARLRPYARLMRLDRPIGSWLLLFPCWWSIALAADGWPDLWLMALFGVGAVVMRGAGCTFNDIVDRDFDARVARTAHRPLPSGQVSVRAAALFMVAQMLVGLAILLALNRFAVGVGAASLLLIFSYPFMKRFTFWPQAWLGLAFNWGALLGWAAVTGRLGSPPLTLYLAGIVWTLAYDTIYALQDKEDDAIVGIKSSALRLGGSTRPWLWIFGAGTLLLTALSGRLAGLSWPFYPLLLLPAAQMAWQVATLAMDTPADCLSKFRSNRWYGWLVLLAIVAGRVL